MLWIAVTAPGFFEGEARFISRMLAHGVDFVHLRKPDSSEDECARLLDGLSAGERARIVVHDHFSLVLPYGLNGIHLSRRHGEIPVGYSGHVSRSCHTFEEVMCYKKQCSYVFLSPVFDSISKSGYGSAFSDMTLRQAASEGILDTKVIALGGVTPDRVPYLRSLGFGGAAMLGCLNSIALLDEGEQDAALDAVRKMMED